MLKVIKTWDYPAGNDMFKLAIETLGQGVKYVQS